MNAIPDPIAAGLARGWQVVDASTLRADTHYEADVVIIGTGAGGGVSAEVLSQAGLKVLLIEEGPLPLDVGPLMQAWPEIGQIGLAAAFDAHPEWEAQASPRYREAAAQGRRLGAPRLWQLMAWVRALRQHSPVMFEQLDVIVTPAAAALPWPAAEPYPPVIDGQPVGPRGHAAYTGWVNAAGLPGLALPADPSAQGLPIGIQLIGAHGHDHTLLALAAAYEAAAPWAARWPDL